MSLLDTAKNLDVRKRGIYSQEELNLAIAYLKGEVSAKQVAITVGIKNGTGINHWFGPRIVRAYQLGLLT
jgi:hypothetical protein